MLSGFTIITTLNGAEKTGSYENFSQGKVEH